MLGLRKKLSHHYIDRIWTKYFPHQDWRQVDDRFPLPGYLSEMANFNSDLRNEQLVKCIKELVSKNERVFVICGNAHAFCVSPALRDAQAIQPEQMVSFLWNDPEQLNNLAWEYYLNKTSTADLQLAVTWITRSIELLPGYENHDTHAWLLYKLGQRDKARDWLTRLLALLIEMTRNTMKFKNCLIYSTLGKTKYQYREYVGHFDIDEL